MAENRTLNIVAAVRDFASGPLLKIGATLTGPFRSAFDRVGRAVSSFAGDLQKSVAIFALFEGRRIVRGLIDSYSEITKSLQDVANQAEATKTTADSLYLLRNAAEANGVGFDKVSAALRTFEKNIGAARLGAKDQNESLRRLGLTTDQFAGANKDAIEQVASVADALATVDDAAVRTQLALKLFGEDTGAALLPLLSQGGQALREFAAGLRASGNALSSEQIQAARQYRIELERLHQTIRTLVETVTAQLTPQLTRFFQDLRRVIEENAPAIRRILTDLFQGVSVVAGYFVKLLGGLRTAFLTIQATAIKVARDFDALRGSTEAAAAATQRLKELDEQIRENNRFTDQLSESFFQLQNALDELDKRPSIQFLDAAGTDAALRDQTTAFDRFFAGFAENARRAVNRWTDFRQAGLDAAQTLVDGGLTAVSNALGDWITRTQKFADAFRQATRSVLTDIGKIIAKLGTQAILSSLFGTPVNAGSGAGAGAAPHAEFGGVFPGTVKSTIPLRRFEFGGVAHGPTIALFGEESAARRGEAFVPLQGGKIPVELSGGGAPVVVINQYVQAWDGRDASRALIEQRGTLRALYASDLKSVRQVRLGVRSAAR